MDKYLGVIGNPIEHSLSPAMHNRALEEEELDYLYLPFNVLSDDLEEAIRGFKVLNFVGFNVTIPHKVSIIPYLYYISEEARLIGAVNTVHIKDDQLHGYNTDGIGFLKSIEEETEVDPVDKKVLIFGAGGAARAIAVQLGLAGADQVIIANRTLAKGEELARELSSKIRDISYSAIDLSSQLLEKTMSTSHIVVNATPVGMESYPIQKPFVRKEWFNREQLVVDLVYRPLQTRFLQLAEEAGAHTLSGIGMLVYQGAEAYQIWTGRKAPIDLMRKTLLEHLN